MAGSAGAKRSRKKYDAKREYVIDTAVELFAENGYASTGVMELGEAVGLARGALYYYIGSKEGLLAEVHDRVLDPLLAEAEVIDGLAAGYRQRLRLMSESLLWQIIHRHAHVRVFLQEYRHLQGARRERYREKSELYTSYIHKILTDADDAGDLYVDDLALTTLSFLNLHNYTYHWLGGRRDLEVEPLARFYCGLFLDGITSSAADESGHVDVVRGREALAELRASAGA